MFVQLQAESKENYEMRTSRKSLVVMLAAVLGMVGAVRAQETTRINMGFASAKPTDLIDIPVTFSGSEGVQANSLLLHVSFPKDTLTYESVERALAAELADAEVKTTVADDKSDKTLGVVEVNVVGKTAIKPGIVAYVKFRVAKDAKKGEIKLGMLDSSAKGADGSPVELAKGDDGNVTLFNMDEEIPVIGCFFFTH